MVEEAEEGHDGVARLDVLQCARHLPFRGCTAGEQVVKIEWKTTILQNYHGLFYHPYTLSWPL